MTIKEALDDIVTSGINLGAGDFVDPEALEVAARVLEKMQWTSVEDRLPEIKQDVLMYFDSGNMAVGFWHDGDEDITFWCANTDDGWYTDCDCMPLYWMPLPDAPKGVNDGN